MDKNELGKEEFKKIRSKYFGQIEYYLSLTEEEVVKKADSLDWILIITFSEYESFSKKFKIDFEDEIAEALKEQKALIFKLLIYIQ